MKRFYLSLFVVTAVIASIHSWAREYSAPTVQINVGAGQSVMMAGQTQTTFIKVGLTGFELPTSSDRAPANIALVLDRSGSMAGEKLAQAKQAAIMALDYLNSNDIVSVVVYDDVVDVIVPATKLTNKAEIARKIERISDNGSTALFAGVSKGASEVRKFLNKERVNRVILLSDGQANIGPSTPNELGQLGLSLAKEGMSVTTIGLGLGYNEDLMVQLAGYSDGNHVFVENAYELADIFRQEFSSVTSVVAQDIDIIIHCAEGVKPIRILGREAEIDGSLVRTKLSQLYSLQEKYVLLEVEIPQGNVGESRKLVDVDVSYDNMLTKKQDKQSEVVSVSFSDSEKTVAGSLNKEVLVPATQQVVNIESKRAIELRDQGKIEEAKKVLQDNAALLRQRASSYASPELSEEAEAYEGDAQQLESENWNKSRKELVEKSYSIEKQQKVK